MAIIGSFKKTASGFHGTLETLFHKINLTIKPADKPGETSPDYRVFAGRSEAGAAWSRTSEKGNDYLSVRLQDHATGWSLDCRLHQAEQGYVLVTNDK